MYNSEVRGRLIEGDKSLGQISEEILAPIHAKTPLWWYAALVAGLGMLGFGAYAIYITLTVGLGTWCGGLVSGMPEPLFPSFYSFSGRSGVQPLTVLPKP
jgi:hypothetical protein